MTTTSETTEQVRRLLAADLAARTGRTAEEILAIDDLTHVDGLNSIVLADAIDAVEDETGLLADADRLTTDAFTSLTHLAETFS